MRPAAYVRVSTAEQIEGYSLETQERAIRRLCAARGWPEPAIYAEPGASAWVEELAARPALTRLLDDVAGGVVDVVLVHQLDRWARNVLVCLSALRDLERAGAEFVSVSENLDFTTPFGRAMLGVLAIFAQLYSDQLSQRVTRALETKRARGLHVGGIPFGAVRIDGALQVDPDRAAHLARFLGLAATESDMTVAERLNAEGIPTQRGYRWAPGAVFHARRRGAWLLDQPDPWPGLWLAVRDRPRRPPVTRSGTVRLLTGLMRCPCGGTVSYTTSGPTRTRPTNSPGLWTLCSNSRARDRSTGCPYHRTRATVYEVQVRQWLRDLPDLRRVRTVETDTTDRRALLIERRRLLGVRLSDLTIAEADYRRGLAALDAELAALPLSGGRLRELLTWLWEFQQRFDELPVGGRNAGLRVLLARVVVCGDTATPVPAPALAALLEASDPR
jgi:DNA invertase Pin-like site-specific DNA recombinase